MEDDVEIKNFDFIESFVNSNTNYASYGPIHTWKLWKIKETRKDIITYATYKPWPNRFYTPGSVTALTKKALDTVGGLSCQFIGLGMEHMEWSYRMYKSGMSLDKPENYVMPNWTKSLGFFDVERNPRTKKNGRRNKNIYDYLIEKEEIKNTDYLDRNLFVKKIPKIFGLGFSKTGTSTLNHALKILGYKSCHYPNDSHTCNQLRDKRFFLDIMKTNDALTDIQTVPFYKQFEDLYDCKFIMTTRDKDKWLKSITNHFNYHHAKAPVSKNINTMTEMSKFILPLVFDKPSLWSKDHFSKIYKEHLKGCRKHFENKFNYLEIDICGGEGWETLCPFLDKPIPKRQFPHEGKSTYR
ncbi:MAG: sulfotransferase family protein [Candidatus Thorarchaeota archaeon]